MLQQIKTSGFKVILLFLIMVSGAWMQTYAQKANTDSIRIARQKQIDSARQARQLVLDSTKAVRQRVTDSMNAARKRASDSLGAIRKYRESKFYKDSVANARQSRLDSIRVARNSFYDSIKTARERVTDSTVAARKAVTDSVRAVQQHRSDSLAVIRKYKESKRYKDSVAINRQQRLDSTRAVRKAYSDSLFTARKAVTDSMNTARKQKMDSVATVRNKVLDSIKAIRLARADSLAKVKENKEKLNKSQEKLKEDKLKLALELKIKKKREAWNNEKMLKKKWSVPRKALQNTFTRYNYYFNADKRMDEALENMQRMRKENYDSLLALYPFDPDRDSAALGSDMDSIIQKASLGIQIHDPRTKWADDLYLLLGQSYYYKGNYEQASNAFRYIISINQQRKAKALKEASAKERAKAKEKTPSIVEEENGGTLDFLKHKSVNNEAILWLARTYTEANKPDEAESILDLLESDKNLPDDLKGRVALEKAYLNLGAKNYKAATPQLAIVAADSKLPDWVRMRAAYMSGQLQAEQGDYQASAASFGQVIDLKPKIEMDFYARKNMASSLMMAGGNQEQAVASLKGMLKDGKYMPYYEQIYYVLGRLAANSNNTKDAIAYLQKSIESPKSTKKQKALSFAGLGNVYYQAGNYQNAKLAYDSAALLSRYAPDDSLIAIATRRAAVLDQVAGPSLVIHTQDSLLALAAMSEKEQEAVVRRYIRMLEQRRADSIFRAENNIGGGNNEPEEAAPAGGGGGNYANWYFSNPALMKQGQNEFRKKWGNRQLADNWRRAGASGGLASSNPGTATGTEEDQQGSLEVDENGIPREASLLAFIPRTEAKQEMARLSIQQAYMDLANAYVKALDDYQRASDALDTLEKRYPGHGYKAEAIYLRYLVALRRNQLPEAQALSQRLQSEYGDTKWAKLVGPGQSGTEGLLASTNGISVSNYYDETYGMMIQREYASVLKRSRDAQRQYKDPVFNNRFRIMEAIALAGSGNYSEADSLLKEFISAHPKDSLRNWAETVMTYIGKNKPVPPKDSSAADSSKGQASADKFTPNAPTPPVPTPTPTQPVVPTPIPTVFTYKPKEEHYVVFAFSKMESKALGIKAAMNDFNTFKYSGQGLATNLEMLQPTQGLILVKKFQSASHAKIYMNALKGNTQVFREYKQDEYQMFLISANNYLKVASDKEVQSYLKFYKNNYR